MTRAEVLARLQGHTTELRRMDVASLAVFGSVARDEAGPDSDVDLLVEFARPVGMFRFLAVKEYLEALLGRPVDLATRDALKRQFRDAILREAIYVSHNESDKNPGLAIRNRGFSWMSMIDGKIEGSEGVC